MVNCLGELTEKSRISNIFFTLSCGCKEKIIYPLLSSTSWATQGKIKSVHHTNDLVLWNPSAGLMEKSNASHDDYWANQSSNTSIHQLLLYGRRWCRALRRSHSCSAAALGQQKALVHRLAVTQGNLQLSMGRLIGLHCCRSPTAWGRVCPWHRWCWWCQRGRQQHPPGGTPCQRVAAPSPSLPLPPERRASLATPPAHHTQQDHLQLHCSPR